jgi:hypothetical protein
MEKPGEPYVIWEEGAARAADGKELPCSTGEDNNDENNI